MATRGEGLAMALREVGAARCLGVDDLACRLFTVALLRGEAGCAGGLADVDESARREASLFWRWYGLAQQSGRVADWRLVFDRWQEILEAAPRSRPLYLNLTAAHHLLADKLEQVGDPGEQWRTVLLPCRACGCVFASDRRGGRYRRSCGECRAPLGIELLRTPHPHGRGLQRGGLIYPRRHPESPLAGAIAVVSVECAHPGCGAAFITTKRGQHYCELHAGGASRVARRRARIAAAA